jgi:hypothetical protein
VGSESPARRSIVQSSLVRRSKRREKGAGWSEKSPSPSIPVKLHVSSDTKSYTTAASKCVGTYSATLFLSQHLLGISQAERVAAFASLARMPSSASRQLRSETLRVYILWAFLLSIFSVVPNPRRRDSIDAQRLPCLLSEGGSRQGLRCTKPFGQGRLALEEYE